MAINKCNLSPSPYLTLKSASDFSFPQGGHAAVLAMLHEHGCALAEEEWVKNHWGEVIWKLAGIARTGAEWSWEEALKQMLYRYESMTYPSPAYFEPPLFRSLTNF
jgi:hypothetical protein